MSAVPSPSPSTGAVDPRLRISAMWVATLVVFAYVDLFSLYRPDVRADLDDGRVHVFDVGEVFLVLATLYVVVPSVMVVLTLVLRPRLNRVVNTVVAGLYLLTVVASAVGEWWYFVLGSLVEVVLLIGVIVTARGLTSPLDSPGVLEPDPAVR